MKFDSHMYNTKKHKKRNLFFLIFVNQENENEKHGGKGYGTYQECGTFGLKNGTIQTEDPYLGCPHGKFLISLWDQI